MKTLFEKVYGLATPWLERLQRLEWVPALLMRIFLGYFFAETGFAKLHDLAGFAERFKDWGIPAPEFNAALSAWTEFAGGALILVGLGTRLVSIPMVINMIVAVVTVKAKHADAISDYFEMDEPLYALGFLWLLFSGPGKASLDALLVRLLGPKPTQAPTP